MFSQFSCCSHETFLTGLKLNIVALIKLDMRKYSNCETPTVTCTCCLFLEKTGSFLLAAVIKFVGRSCVSSSRVVGLGSCASVGACGSSHRGGRCLLHPRALAHWLEGRRARASAHPLLVPLADLALCLGTLAAEIIEVADAVSFTSHNKEQ